MGWFNNEWFAGQWFDSDWMTTEGVGSVSVDFGFEVAAEGVVGSYNFLVIEFGSESSAVGTVGTPPVIEQRLGGGGYVPTYRALGKKVREERERQRKRALLTPIVGTCAVEFGSQASLIGEVDNEAVWSEEEDEYMGAYMLAWSR